MDVVTVLQDATGGWWPYISTAVTVASLLCPFLPVPSNPVLKAVYKGVQVLAANVGRAKNAQDVKK